MDVFNVGGFLSFGSPVAAESEEAPVVSPALQIKKTQSTSVQSSLVSLSISSETPHDGTMKAYQSRLDRMKKEKDETPQAGGFSILNWAVLGSTPDVSLSPARRRPAAADMIGVSDVKKSGSSGSMANLVPVTSTNNNFSSPVPLPPQRGTAVQSLISPPATVPTPAAAPSSTNEANELRYQLEIHDLRRQRGLTQAAKAAAEDALKDFRVQVDESKNAQVAAEQHAAVLQQEMRDSTAKFTLDFTELEGRLEQARVDLTASQKDAEDKARQLADLTSTIADLSPKLAMSTTLMEQLAQANAALEKQVEEVTAGLTSCQNDRAEAIALLTDSSRKLNLAMLQLEQMNEKNNALQDLLDDARLDLSKCQQDRATVGRQIEDVQKVVTERDGWIGDKDKIISQLNELLVAGEKTQSGLTNDLKQQTACSEALRNQLEQACEDVIERQQNIAEKDEIIDEFRELVASGKKVVAALEFPLVLTPPIISYLHVFNVISFNVISHLISYPIAYTAPRPRQVWRMT